MINIVITLMISLGLLLMFVNNNKLFKYTIVFSYFTVLGLFLLLYGTQNNISIETFYSSAIFTNPKISILLLFVISFIVGNFFLINKMHNDKEKGIVFSYFATSLGIICNSNLSIILSYWEVLALLGALIIAFSDSPIKKSIFINYFIVHILGGVLLLIGVIGYYILNNTFEITNIANTNNPIYIILALGILINLALPPFSAWLVNGYSNASTQSTIFLSIYTTKSAMFLLFLLFAGNNILIFPAIAIILYAVILSISEKDIRKLLAYAVMHTLGITLYIVAYSTEFIALSYLIMATLFKIPMFLMVHKFKITYNSTNILDLSKKINIFSLYGLIIIIFSLDYLSVFGFSSYVSKYYLHKLIDAKESLFLSYLFTILASLGAFILALPLLHKVLNYSKKVTIDAKDCFLILSVLTILVLLTRYFIVNINIISIKQALVYSIESIVVACAFYFIIQKATKSQSNLIKELLLTTTNNLKIACVALLKTTTLVKVYEPILILKNRIYNINYPLLNRYSSTNLQALVVVITFLVIYVLMLTF